MKDEPRRKSPHDLLELIGAGTSEPQPTPDGAATLSREEVEELVRKTLREELARLSGPEPRKG